MIIQILFFFISFCLSQENSCGITCQWSFNETTNVLTIQGTGKMNDYPLGSSPWFKYSTLIEKIIIEEGITSIGDMAFSYHTNVTEIELPNTLETIGFWSFDNTQNLESVTFPESLISLKGHSFESSGIISFNIPKSLESLGIGSFYNCIYLTTIEVDENNPYYSLDTDGVLYNKEKTTLVLYPTGKEVTSKSYSIPESVTTISDYALAFSKFEEIKLNSVQTIGDYAFSGCSQLRNIEFSTTVKSIGSHGFEGCSIKYLILPTTIESIGEGAFAHCSSLTYIEYPVGIPNEHYGIFDGIFNDVTFILYGNGPMNNYSESSEFWGSLKEYIKVVKIDKGVTSIGDYAFWYFKSLQTVIIGDDVQTIGARAFYESTIEVLSLPSSVKTIEPYAFENCYNLMSISLNNGLETIKHHAFYACSKLQSITIPSTVTTMESEIFSGCAELNSAEFENDMEKIEDRMFENCVDLEHIGYPNNLKEIGIYSFKNCRALQETSLPSNVTTIRTGAFQSSGLEEVTIKSNITLIEDEAFAYCHSLLVILNTNNEPTCNPTVFKGTDVSIYSEEEYKHSRFCGIEVSVPEQTTQTISKTTQVAIITSVSVIIFILLLLLIAVILFIIILRVKGYLHFRKDNKYYALE